METFLDGDFLEVFLDLGEEEQVRVVNAAREWGMSGVGVRELRMLLEGLRQMH